MDFEGLEYWITAANDLLDSEAREAKAAHERAERDAARGRQ